MATNAAQKGALLVDIQVPALGAGQTLNSVNGATASASGGTIQMTPNSVGLTQPPPGTVWDCLYLVVHPGVLAPGANEPDLWLFPFFDLVASGQGNFFIDISVTGNVAPRLTVTEAEQGLLLGNSMIMAAERIQAGQQALPRNAATVFTGWKITRDLTLGFYSQQGFTAATWLTPPTIKVYGDVYDVTALQWLDGIFQSVGGWGGNISLNSFRRQYLGKGPYLNQHQIAGNSINKDTFNQLPGGSGQGGVKAWRYLKSCFLGASVPSPAPFVLSQVASVGGKVGNVSPLAAFNDLGYDYTNNNNCLMVTEYGRRPGPGAGSCGITFGGVNILPPETTYGLMSTFGDPKIPYGQEQPWLAGPGKYFKLLKWGAWSAQQTYPEIVAKETCAFMVAAQLGATIAAAPSSAPYSTLTMDRTTVGGVYIGA